MMPGEMYADFAAGLRDLVGRNKASERVLLAQFYRCLVKTTQKLVKQGKEPRTLEEAVDCPTEIDDPMDNTAVIPGIGGPGLPADVMALATGGTTTAEPLQNTIALFTNPQGVWNPYSATWDVPAGRVWNGRFWAETNKNSQPRSQATRREGPRKPERKVKTKREVLTSSEDEAEPQPKIQKFKAAVRQVSERQNTGGATGSSSPGGNSRRCHNCGEDGHWAAACPADPKCYACNQFGHFAKEFSDAAVKAKNDDNPQQDVASATIGHDVVYKVNEEDVVIGDEKRESGGNEDGVVEERGETASGAHEQVPRGQSCDGSKRTTHGGVVVGRVTGTAPKDFVDIKGCMDEEVEIRDNQRAGRYVATVRPALTSARYVRADARNAPAEMDEDEVLQTEEGVCVPKVVVSRNDDHWSDGESPDTATTSPGEDGVVAELRAARKLEKN
ncbi:hypothetical protein PC110_g20001 [Phytophthora cactorum]|uniref:CCHC-type domain-containing protein n=2 Tax=Phytophthora cactorum TaxID=29920 RepID=A0A329RFX5_9STRA|nr:hypothetical protein PC110_g20001 [Phytophthora cactorum]